MKMELSFLLTILLWIYQVSTDNHFSVQTTCTPQHNWPNEIEINCTVCGFSDLDFLKFEVEWLLQKNLSITSPAKITPGNVRGNFSKYTWEFIPVNDDDCQGNKTVFNLVVKSRSSLSLGIYTCYVTLNNSTLVTKYSSVDFSSGKENASQDYVLMRNSNVPVAEIAESCTKYGYNVFMDDSVVKSVSLQENDSVYFPVCPSININNQSIAVCKPWISRQGCYNLTTDSIGMEMDCRSINIANWNKSLPLIGMTTVGSCYLLDGDVRNSHPNVPDAYCLTDEDFNNFQENKKAVFLTLYSIININPKHTEEINSDCVATYMDLEPSGSTLYEIPCHKRCDAYCTLHDGSNITYLGPSKKWEDARKECNRLNKSLPNENFTFSDPTQFNITSTVCLDVFKNSSVLFQPVVKLASKENGGIIINASTNHSMRLQYLCGTKIG